MSDILHQSLSIAIAKLGEFTLQATFLEQLAGVFGDAFDLDIALGIVSKLQAGDSSFLPSIEVRSGAELAGANGAYDATGDRIFVSADFLAANVDNSSAIVNFLLEEIGHKFDILLNGEVDSAGDEGAIFAAIVQGKNLSADTLAQLRSENDRRTLTIDGQQVAVEMQTYVGTSGNDYLVGTAADDILDGLEGDDTLIGDAGDDTIDAGLGLDLVDGGDGNDLLIVDYSSNIFSTGITTSVVWNYGSFNGSISASNSPFSFDRVDFYNIERFQITGTTGNDFITGGYYQDTLIAGAGDDTIDNNFGGDIIDGGAGFDILNNADWWGTTDSLVIDDLGTAIITSDGTSVKNIEQFNKFYTGSGNDVINFSQRSNNTIITNFGDDTINAGLGLDLVDGGDGNDLLIVNYSSNIFSTGITTSVVWNYGSFNGSISASNSPFSLDRVDFYNIERFQITGTTGNDFITGGYYQDTLIAGAGDDTIDNNFGGDIIDGGTGFDTLISTNLWGSTESIVIDDLGTAVTLSDGTSISNIEQFNNLVTGSGNEVINFSQRSNNTIATNFGDDTIDAGLGLDLVDGGDGNDLLIVDYSSNIFSMGITSSVVWNYGSFNGSISASNSPFSFDRVDFTNIERFQITGTAANDLLAGGYYQDIFYAGAGDDIILDSYGGDIIDGGTGFDTLGTVNWFSSTESIIVDDLGTEINLSDGTKIKNIEQFYNLTTGSGNDVIHFSRHNYSQINTNFGNDTIHLGLGWNSVDGGEGNDLLIVDYSSNQYLDTSGNGISTSLTWNYGGFNGSIMAPNGTMFGNRVEFSNIERFHITGTSGKDTLIGGYWQDTLIGEGGDDIIDNNYGDDIIDGGTGLDTILNANFGGIGDSVIVDDLGTTINFLSGGSIRNIEQFNYLTTSSGNDVINFSRQGNNVIYTGYGDDTINAGLGVDSVNGEDGNDLLIVDYSNNTFVAAYPIMGISTMLQSNGIGGYNGSIMAPNGINMYGDRVDFSNIERFHITGTVANDNLVSGSGQDTFIGGAGDDIIDGGNGGDTVIYAGERNTYSIERTDTVFGTSWIVTDTNVVDNGNDGIDRLTNVASLTFVNGDNLLVSDLIGSLSDNNLDVNIIDENSANGTIIGGLQALAIDGEFQEVSYSLVDNAGGRFAIDSSSGLLSVANSSLLNFEAIPSHEVIVKAISADGSFTQQSFTIGVANVNEAPTGSASAILINGTEDTAYTIDIAKLLTGFTDVDGDSLSVANLNANDGSISFNNGVYTLTPAANYNGVVNLTYNVIDGNGGSIAANSSFNLAAVNDTPTGTASASLLNATEDTSYIINLADLLTGFSDVDGDTLSVANLSANRGSIVVNNGVCTFNPDANYNGVVNLTYDVVDGNGGTIAANSTFNLTAVNDEPTGTTSAPLINGTEDTPYIINLADLLIGFSDIDGDSLSVANLTADCGSISVNNEIYTFTPTTNYNGIVNLTYNVIDGNGGIVAANSSLNLAAVNDAPTGTASATFINGTEDTAYTIDIAKLLTGFSDVDGNSLSVANLSANNGSISVNNGVYTFNPDANYHGVVNLTYNVIDDNGGTIAANSTFNLTTVNDEPTGTTSATLINGTEDTAYTIDIAKLLTGFSDVDGDSLSVANLSANNGSIVVNNGVYTFNPDANYHGVVNLTYDVIDGNGGTIAANSTFNLTVVNDAPTATTLATLINGIEDTYYVIDIAKLLTGVTDVDGDSLSVANLTADRGSISVNNGVYTFTPNANYNGIVNLTYNVIDGNGGTIATNSSFNLAAINDTPTGTASASLTNGTEDTAYIINLADLLTGFSDVDGDSLSVANLSANNGSISFNNGVYTFTPAANYNGVVNLTYDVFDGNAGSIATNYSFNLAAVNDTPIGTASASLPNGTEDTPYIINLADLLIGFSDVDGDNLSVANLTADCGSISVNNGVYTFTSAANYNGVVNLTYNVIDGNGGIVVANSTFNLAAVNDAPTGTTSATLINGTEDTAYTIDLAKLLTGFSDVDGDTLSVANLSANNGSISVNNGVHTFTPNANYFGNVNLTYNIVDGNGGTIAANSNFNLAAVADTWVKNVTTNLSIEAPLIENLTLTGTSNINGTGNNLNNIIIGNSGNNILDGGAGNDTMNGGAGNDTYIFNVDTILGIDIINETANNGSDTISFSGNNNISLNLSLTSSQFVNSNLTLSVLNIENVTGGNGNDTITGNSLANILTGGVGIDTLIGGDGNDTLAGGAGDDILTGGNGNDLFVFGGSGFTSAAAIGLDTIQGFVIGQDKIQLSKSTFTLSTLSNSTFKKVTSDAAAATSNGIITYNSTNGKLFYDTNGSSLGFGTNGGQFAILATNLNLSASDFSLIS